MVRHGCSLIVLLLALVYSGPMLGQDFRVESKVYSGDEPTPVSQNSTLFYGGRVYDFLQNPTEIAVYDLQRKRIFLLSPARGIQTEVTAETLDEYTRKLQQWAATQPDPLLKFAAAPMFSQSVGDNTKDGKAEAVFASEFVTYQVTTEKAKSAEIAQTYRQFSDLSVRLNGLTNPGVLPPFPRMEVSRGLAASECLPAQVRLIIASKRFGAKPLLAHSEHKFHWRVVESDKKRIFETDEYLASLTKVGLQQYLHLEERQARR